MKVCSIGDFEHYCHLATATWLLHKFCVNPVVLKVFNKRPILFKKKIVIIIIKKNPSLSVSKLKIVLHGKKIKCLSEVFIVTLMAEK